MRKIYLLLLASLFCAQVAFSQTVITVSDDDLQSGQYFWTSDNIYLLNGFVFLEAGGELYIEAGTVIKGKEVPTTNDLASTLIITRGAQINAVGEAGSPIIFTAEIDDTNDPFDLTVEDRGLWGGVILLGNAVITDETTEQTVEGLPPADPRALYGGNNDDDNSGRLSYVSIRHGGAELAPGEEINGLTLGAVGSETQIDHVEVIANSDDGIEWFGGTAAIKYASVSFCGDDSYDYDTGWRGKGQFWLSLQSGETGDNGGEHDGAKPDDNEPTSSPVIYNATFIGCGVNSPAKNEHALYFRDGSAGTYANSIFTDFANFAIQVEDRASGVDSRQRMENGRLNLLNNIWFGFGEGTELNAGTNGILQATDDAEDPNAMFLVNHLTNNANSLADPQLNGISRVEDGGFDPRPSENGPAYSGGLASLPGNDGFYSDVPYKGAFCTEGVWIKGWTAISEYGVLNGGVPFVDACETTSLDEVILEEEKLGYVLTQNSPNPFSGATRIKFDLPETKAVSLTIFDAYGQVVTHLIDSEVLAAGTHMVDFNAENLSNGMYFYTLRSADVILTKTMVISQ